MIFKHQILEVVASSVLFNVTNPEMLPGSRSMFLAINQEFVVLNLISCWLMFWHICRWILATLRQSRTFCKVTQFLPDKGFTIMFGFLHKVSLGLIGLELSLSVDVLKHLMITPIVLHASYSIYHPNCFTQLRTIFLTSITATLLSVVSVTVFLSQVYAPWLDQSISVFDSLIFASAMSAVDPVAVLAAVDQVMAGSPFYYLVLVGSLVNDGAAFLLFEGLKPFTGHNQEELSQEFDVTSLAYGIASFIVDPLAGGILGFLSAYLVSTVIKNIDDEQNFIKPLLILLMSAFPYVASLVFGFSMAVGLIVYGITVELMISKSIRAETADNITGIMRGLSVTLNALIYFYIGFETTQLVESLEKIWRFAVSMLFVVTVSRAVITLVICNILNLFILTKYTISWKWQIIWTCGGVRGAVAYAFAYELQMLEERKRSDWAEKIHDSTVFIIFISTLLFGILVKIMSKLLNVSEGGKELVPDSEAAVIDEGKNDA